MQAYDTGLAITATRGPGLSGTDYDRINKQVNILISIGQFLAAFGLAILFAIVLSTIERAISNRRTWRRFVDWKGIGLLVARRLRLSGLGLLSVSTYPNLIADFNVHYQLPAICLFVGMVHVRSAYRE